MSNVKHIAVGDIVKFASTENTQKGIVLSFVENHSFFDTKVLWESGKITHELAFSLMRMDGPRPASILSAALKIHREVGLLSRLEMKVGDIVQSRAFPEDKGIIVEMIRDPEVPDACKILWSDGRFQRAWTYAIEVIEQ